MLEEAKKSKKSAKAKEKEQCEDMDSLVKTMKEEGLSDEDIEKVFSELENEALDGIITKLKNEGYSDDEIVEIINEEYAQIETELSEDDEGIEGNELTPAQQIIMAAIDQEPAKIQAIFDQEIKTRASGIVDEYKGYLAQNLFNPPEPPEEVEDEEDDELDGESEDDLGDEVDPDMIESETEKAIGAVTKITRYKDQVKKGRGMGLKTKKTSPGRHIPTERMTTRYKLTKKDEAIDPENDAPELVGVKKKHQDSEIDEIDEKEDNNKRANVKKK